MTAPEPTRRLFFALWPTEALRHDLEHETRHAARHSGGRVIPASNLHITLAFLGAVPDSRFTAALACQHALQVKPFELLLGTLGWWERQQLLCLEPVGGGETLKALVGELHLLLRSQGFVIEHLPFRAHVTLARDVRRPHEFKPIKQLRWEVNRIDLIESRVGSSGSTYTRYAPALSPSTMSTSRSCVRGRGKGSSERMRRMAWASPGPIQMGRMRSPSASRRMTMFCWVLCSRMSPLTRASTTFTCSRTSPCPADAGRSRSSPSPAG